MSVYLRGVWQCLALAGIRKEWVVSYSPQRLLDLGRQVDSAPAGTTIW